MMHRNLTLLALMLPLLAACGPEAGFGGSELDDAFCRGALDRVDAFMASYEEDAAAPGDADDPVNRERRGGTVVAASIGEIADGMNALVSGDYVAHQHQNFVNLMTLIRFDQDLQPVPYLAESWEFSDDRSALTFHLRDDVLWHDGERTTAHDVAFTYLRATDPETAFPNNAYWTHYVPGEAGVEVVDSFTVRFQLRPHAQMLDPWRSLSVMPEHLLGEVPPAELRNHPFGSRCPVGNGPFRFVEHRPDERWTFAANPAFPEGLGGRPNVDRYVYRVVPEMTTLVTELLTENIDVFMWPNPDQVESILESDATRLVHYPFRNYVFVGWNSRRPQFEDARVRRAITLGTNRQEIIDALLHGYGQVANAGVPPTHPAYLASIEDSLRYNPAAARALLDDAGWIDRDGDGIRESEDGVRLAFSIKYNDGNRQRQDIAEIMQSQLRQVGMEVRPQSVEWSTLYGQITGAERDFDGVVIAWVTDFKVDDTNLFHSRNIDEPFALSGTSDPRLDQLMDTLQLVVDEEDAIPLWHEYQQLLLELQPFTYFLFQERLVGLNARLQDVEMDVRGEWVNITDWWIPADRRRQAERTAGR